MKELKKMNLNELKTLSRKEMKSIMAGSGPSVTGGSCTGSAGTWYYTHPVWYINCWRDIATYCPSGGGTCF